MSIILQKKEHFYAFAGTGAAIFACNKICTLVNYHSVITCYLLLKQLTLSSIVRLEGYYSIIIKCL